MAKKKPKQVDLSVHIGEITLNKNGQAEDDLKIVGNPASAIVVAQSMLIKSLQMLNDRGEQMTLAMQCCNILQDFAGVNGEDDPRDVVKRNVNMLYDAILALPEEDRDPEVGAVIQYLYLLASNTKKETEEE